LALQKANSLIHAIPSGVVIVNKDLKILECNENFAKLYGSNLVDEYKKNGLKNSDLTQIVKNHNLFSILLSSEDTEFIDREVHEDNKIFHFRIFYIENKNIIAAVIEDITAPGIRKNRIITQAQKVIDKNLEVVQKIAFLLGENAAETEAMLNSIIESYGN
jgi:PAS domain-containing protein